MPRNSGKVFEDAIKESVRKIPEEIYYCRLPDPASSFQFKKADDANQQPDANQPSNGLRFSIKNDYDCFFYKYPHLFPVELKSIKGTSFSIQFDKKERRKIIKKHQIDGLLKASMTRGVMAGFLFNFSSKKIAYWLEINSFKSFMDSTSKKSINEKDIIEWGGIIVKQTLKRVNYHYHINEFLDEMISLYVNNQ